MREGSSFVAYLEDRLGVNGKVAVIVGGAGGRGGSIINFTSIEGHRAAPGVAVYAGMKWGVEGFSRSLAVELGPEGIRVNTIAPDMTPTEGMRGIRAGTGWDRYDDSPPSEMT